MRLIGIVSPELPQNYTANRYLKAELKPAVVGYKELAERLTAMGLQESEGSITVKINRGTFPAWFLIAAMESLGATEIRI